MEAQALNREAVDISSLPGWQKRPWYERDGRIPWARSHARPIMETDLDGAWCIVSTRDGQGPMEARGLREYIDGKDRDTNAFAVAYHKFRRASDVEPYVREVSVENSSYDLVSKWGAACMVALRLSTGEWLHSNAFRMNFKDHKEAVDTILTHMAELKAAVEMYGENPRNTD